jgi:hypothetical protein
MGRHLHRDRHRAARAKRRDVRGAKLADHPEEQQKDVVGATMMRRPLAEDAAHDEGSVLIVRNHSGQQRIEPR